MKKGSFFRMLLCLVLALSACRAKEKPTILVPKAENLAGDFIMGADVSTLLTQEAAEWFTTILTDSSRIF